MADASPARPRLSRRLKVAFWSGFATRMIKLYGKTWRTRWDGSEVQGNVVFALWHEGGAPGVYIGRGRGYGSIVSQHGDGEILARVSTTLGYHCYRGSSTRGGMNAMLQILRDGESRSLVITPDGPKGPYRVVKSGTIVLASKLGYPIVPTGLAARPCWRARNWDRLIIPKPFAKVRVVSTEPIEIPPDLDPVERKRWQRKIGEELDRASLLAQRALDS